MFDTKPCLDTKPCPISGLWPHLYPTPDGTYYFTCSPMCTWNISDSTDCALCNYEKNTYSSICTKKHVRESDAVAEWNDLMTAKTKYEKGDDTMLKAKPCPISGLTPEPNHWAEDAWFYECDSRCPRIKNCRLATPVYVHQTDAAAGWNRLIKDIGATTTESDDRKPESKPSESDDETLFSLVNTPCPLSGLWPWVRQASDGRYYVTCSTMCPWNISNSPEHRNICSHTGNAYKAVSTGTYTHKNGAAKEWNDMMRKMKQKLDSKPEPDDQKLSEYEKYQLQWMIDHGHSLNELIAELTAMQNNDPEDFARISTPVTELFAEWAQDRGFGSEIWACEAEWHESEASGTAKLE